MRLHDFYVTKEFIFSITTQEKIFSTYLYVPDLKASYINPFREDDTSPGCTFYYKYGKLYFVDWAHNKKHYDCFNVVMEYYKCGITQALKHIKEDVERGFVGRISENDVKQQSKKNNTVKVKVRDFRTHELKFWNIGGLVITQQLLNSKGIYAVETIWEQDWIIDNCDMHFAYIEEGNLTQVYIPKNKGTGRRRFINQEGFVMGGKNSLPYISDHVVISKSRKCSFYIDLFDTPNLYMVSESSIIDADTYAYLKLLYKTVFYLGDNDWAGKKTALKYRKTYPDVVILLFEKGEPKDFPDNLEKYGYQYMIDRKEDLKKKFNLE